MEDGQACIGIAFEDDNGLDVMSPSFGWRQLQCASPVRDGLSRPTARLSWMRKNSLGRALSATATKARSSEFGSFGKPGIVLGQIGIAYEPVGDLDLGKACQNQVPGRTALKRVEHTLTAPARF